MTEEKTTMQVNVTVFACKLDMLQFYASNSLIIKNPL